MTANERPRIGTVHATMIVQKIEDTTGKFQFCPEAGSDPVTVLRLTPDGTWEFGEGWNPATLRAIADWLEREQATSA